MPTRRAFLTSLLAAPAALAACWPDDDRVRVRIWHQKNTPERLFLDRIVEAYNVRQTDHYIEPLYKENEELRNQFIIAASGGQGPELIFGPADNIGLLQLTRTIRPLDDLLPADLVAAFTDDGLVRRDGALWMLGDQIGNHLTLVYNRALVDAPPETTAELVALGRRLTADRDGDGEADRYGLTWNYREPFFFVPFLTGYGGRLVDDAGRPTLDTPETVRAIRFVLDLRDRHGIIPRETDYDTAQALFMEARAGMIINGPWAWASYGEAGIDYALAPLPVVPETGLRCAPLISAKGYSVNASVDPAKLPYVARVLTHLTGPDVQRAMAAELATVPVRRALLDDPVVQGNPVLQDSLVQIRYGLPMPLDPRLRQVWDGMRGPYQLVMNGAVEAEEGARMMQRNVEKLIADTFL